MTKMEEFLNSFSNTLR